MAVNSPAIMKFVRHSERRERRFAPVMLPLYGVGAFFVGAIVATVASVYVGPNNPAWPWQYNVPFYAALAASTCAIGLWRYRGFDTKRSVLAGVSILVLCLVTGPHSAGFW